MSSTMTYTKKELPKSLIKLGLSLSIIGLVAMVINFAMDHHDHHVRFWYMYTIMFMFLICVGVGALTIVALEHLTGAYWSVPFRRVLEIISWTLPITGIIGLPLLFQQEYMFHWFHPEGDHILEHKAAYLNSTFFTIRYFVYFIIWTAFAWIFSRNSLRQEEKGEQRYTTYNLRWSAFFMCCMALTTSFCAIDWIMSLEPHWFSTMFGVYFFSGMIVTGFAVLALFGIYLKEKGYLHPGTNKGHFYPIGTFLFGFNCFWCYIAFCQFMLIWYGNLPEETFFFIPRWEGNWQVITIILMLLHFIVPFYGLVGRPAKTNSSRLKFFAVWLLAMQFLDLYWLIMGSLKNHDTGATEAPSFNVFDLGFIAFAVGIVISVFYFKAKKVNLVPVNDPKLEHGLHWHP
jgi:hypothetical protein